jgi:antitoxin HigA-1
MPIQLHSSFAVHPGDWLKTEVVEPYGISVTDLARHLGVSRPALSALLNGRAGLSGDMAIRFEKAFGLRAETLLRMQAAHELVHAREHEDQIDVGRLELADA